MKLVFVTIGLLALAVLGIAIKIWAKKDGEFAGTCASQNPMLNKEGEPCGFCGKMPETLHWERNDGIKSLWTKSLEA